MGVGLVRDRQAAADVDGVDRTDAVGETCQLGVDLAPVRRRDDATAQVRMDAADACIELPGSLTKVSNAASGSPNFDAVPPVTTLAWCPSPRPRSMRSHSARPRKVSGQLPRASTLSIVTVTPSAKAASYSTRGAKLGVNSTRAGSRSGSTENTCSSSPSDTHSSPKPSATSARSSAWCGLALIAK